MAFFICMSRGPAPVSEHLQSSGHGSLVRNWLLTGFATLVALYLVLGTFFAWAEAAWNQAQGGRDYVDDVVFDLLMALVAPGVFIFVLRLDRATLSRTQRYRAACGWASMVGMVLLFLRIVASAGF